MKNLYLLFFLLLQSLWMQGATIRLLTIGNSFSEDAVEQNVYELCLGNDLTLVIGNAYRGGQGLASHWNVATNNLAEFEYRKIVGGVKTKTPSMKLKDIVTDEPWDIITFQQVSQDSGLETTYEPYLTNLINYVKGIATNPDMKLGLHMTWAYAQTSTHSGFANYGYDQTRMYEAIVNAVSKAKADHPEITYVVPAGTAIQNARTSILGDNMTRDGYHLDMGVGRYTAACTWAEILTGKDIVGNTFRPTTVDATAALIAQKAAHYAVITPNSVTTMANEGYDGDNTTVPENKINLNIGAIPSANTAWNNITPNAKIIANMSDATGNPTNIAAIINDSFSGTNEEGMTGTTTEMNMPDDVSRTCVWGYANGSFGGQPQNPTSGILFSHMNTSLAYDFVIFGSRKNANDNRETIYKFTGSDVRLASLDAANNKDKVAVVKNVKPNANGQIQLTVSAGDNNTNAYKFYHINALQITAHEAVTHTEPVEISTAEELLGIEPDVDYVLTADINLEGYDLPTGITDTYMGTLDGNGHVIYNATIGKGTASELGLFRHLRGATVKNLGIENTTVAGAANVGILAGMTHGAVIENCYIANSSVTGKDHVASFIGQMEGNVGVPSKISDCYSTANVYSTSYQGGGLVGTTKTGAGSIRNSYFAGRVQVTSQRASGIMALQDNDDNVTIENCATLATQLVCPQVYRIASVRAGKSTLTNNYALSTISTSLGTDQEKGIDVTKERALQQAFYADDLLWTFDDSSWKWIDGSYPILSWQKPDMTSTALVYNSNAKPTLTLRHQQTIDLSEHYTSGRGGDIVYTAESDLVTLSGSMLTIAKGKTVDDFIDITISATQNGFAPTTFTVSLIPEKITIATANDFVEKIGRYPGGTFVLASDLSFEGITSPGVENFTGSLDGNGFVIRKLKYNDATVQNVGLFRTMKGASIRNLGIDGADINGANNTSALVGTAEGGTIEKVFVINSKVTGDDRVSAIASRTSGGLVISDCYVADTDITARTHQAGGIAAAAFTGGVKIDRCYFSGSIKSTWGYVGAMLGLVDTGGAAEISNSVCLATSIDGGKRSRIVCWGGQQANTTLTNNYSLNATTPGAGTWISTDGQQGMTLDDDALAMTMAFYKETLGWDFDTTWSIEETTAYPKFKVGNTPAGIEMTDLQTAETIYTIDGLRIGNDHRGATNRRGIYITKGRKVIAN